MRTISDLAEVLDNLATAKRVTAEVIAAYSKCSSTGQNNLASALRHITKAMDLLCNVHITDGRQ